MSARYLIRLDDACPTMAHHNWTRLEEIFDSLKIKPIVAIVPDNQDPALQVEVEDPAYWERVRRWQLKGWTIALHGYQHVFHEVDSSKLVLPFYDRSEFAGLSLMDQAHKVRAGWDICKSRGVTPTAWIAPAHCFDSTTLQALIEETPIRVISDGIAMSPYCSHGFLWLPQQLWSFTTRHFGLWTVCLHPNSMKQSEIDDLFVKLASPYYRQRIVAVDHIEKTTRGLSLLDRLYATYFWNHGRIIRKLISMRRWLKQVEK